MKTFGENFVHIDPDDVDRIALFEQQNLISRLHSTVKDIQGFRYQQLPSAIGAIRIRKPKLVGSLKEPQRMTDYWKNNSNTFK